MDLGPSSTSLSAASFYRPPLSADSFISIFSSTANLATTSAIGQIPYPLTLGGTSVNVTDAQGTSRPAELVYAGPLTSVSPSQINLIIPTGTVPGPADLTITNSNGDVTRETLTIEATSPAIFAANFRGRGPAAAYIQRSDIPPGDPPAFTFTNAGGQINNTPISVSGVDTYLNLFGTGIRGAKSVKGIDSNVAAALISEKLHDGVKYSVKNHVVTLTGEVDSQAKRARAEEVVAAVPNVQQVVNELQVKEQKASSTR